MRTDIIEYLQKEVRRRCELPANRFGMGCYDHIEAVVKNAALLAQSCGADVEVVTIAAWLHDVASVTDYSLYAQHHIHGAEMAREMLAPFDYDAEKLALVQACIRNHRGSVQREKCTPEESCVADADAVAHFDSVPSLLYLAFVERGMSLPEGKAFVRGKLERSYRKLSPVASALFAEKYRRAMDVLGGE